MIWLDRRTDQLFVRNWRLYHPAALTAGAPAWPGLSASSPSTSYFPLQKTKTSFPPPTVVLTFLLFLGKSSGQGGSAISLPADFQSLEACKALAAELTKREGATGLHVLVNNSGAAWGEAFDSHPDHAWTKLLTLNLQRVFTLTQLLTPLLERGGSGSRAAAADAPPARVINIGSIDALRVPALENYAYSASKAGLHHLSKTMAVALGPRGITVNTLACGPFPSKMMKAVLDAAGKELAEANPLGRIGTPQDVAGACLFLCGRAG